ncbi:MAG: bifunctional homocysteine S-methyltransferase/methylenetetrahydrofolate reductase [Victivallales bacterium]
MQNKLKEALENKVLVFDGAMGTEIYRRNFFVNTSYENLCVSNPKVIGEIHRSYLEAGAEVLTANSYGANFNKLAKFGLAERLEEINRAAVRLAKEAADGKALVAASVGPIGDIPKGMTCPKDKAVGIIAGQIRALASGEPDFILFETLRSLSDVEVSLAALEIAAPDMPFMVSVQVDREAQTQSGDDVAAILACLSASALQPSAFGINCGSGPEAMLSAYEKFAHDCPYPVVVQPNAGAPKNVDNRMIYMSSPEYFTTYAMRYISLGARGIGGCCGTTPDHIRDMARSINPMAKIERAAKVQVTAPEIPLKEPVPTAEKSRLAGKLAAREWVYTVEIVPPQGYLLAQTVEKSRLCAAAGFDAVNIPDGPRASSRVSPLVTACKIQEGAGIETILHFCCRDKNLIGMQADLLGCAAMDINNILFITGDPPKLGDYPFASGVFDMDSIGMVRVQSRLNRGVDLAGKPIDAPTKAFIAVGADPNAIDMEREIRRSREKIEAGAEAFITQPVFDVEPLLRFIDAIPELRDGTVPLIAGIWPLASYRNAEFMRNEVPGVVVPDSVMERMAAPATKEEQRQVGIAIAREAIASIRGKVAGAQISAPFGNVNTAIAVME